MDFGITTRLKAFANPLSILEGSKSDLFKFDFLNNLTNNFNYKKPISEGYNSNAYVYAIVNLIANLSADLDLKLVRYDNKGNKEDIEEGDAYDFLHNPNDKQSLKEYTYAAIINQLLLGNVFELKVKPIGFNQVSERHLMAQSNLEIDFDYTITGAYVKSYDYTMGGTVYHPPVDEVVHTKLYNPDYCATNPILGLSPLQAAYNTLVASNEVINADANLIRNNGVLGMVTNRSQEGFTGTEAKQITENLRKKIGGSDKFGGVATTSANVDFLKMSMSPSDLKILENGVMKLRDLCTIYGVSSKLFNDPTGSTFNNITEDNKRLYKTGVIPPLERYIDSLNTNFISTYSDEKWTYKVELDTESIEVLQVDQLKKVTKAKYRSEIQRSIIEGVTAGTWSKASAINQLVDTLGMDEEEAKKLLI